MIINSVISPFLGVGFLHNGNRSNLADIELKIDDMSFITSNHIDNGNFDSTLSINKQDNIFGELLIKSIESTQKSDVTEIKIIMLFKEETSKSERIELISSIIDEYEIIDNYDIIPAVYLKCDPHELFAKKETLQEILALEKIFKSRIYESPYYQEQLPKTSALNTNNYPNWWLPAIGAENLVYDGTGVKVAVLDTGIYEHPDLNIVANENFVTDELPFEYNDDIGHGTHVAGIIGGNGSASGGKYRGVAPGVSLINARAGGSSGLEEGDVISAIQWSVNTAGADIISMSFGDTYPIASDPIILALANATELGVICVSSAGNSGPEYISGGSPASGIDVISVGASDSNNNLASFSSWGPSLSYLSYPDIVAPGVHIISTEAPNTVISDENRLVGDFFDYSGDGDYIPLSGTSMACPIVAGALAILKQAYPSITPETARVALLEGAQVLSNEGDAEFMKSGYGIINLTASLVYLDDLNGTYSDVNNIAKITPNELPINPYDLINFPGDNQLFNLTVISGKNSTLDINYPTNIDGITLSVDKPQIIFDGAGVDFVALRAEIDSDAVPGTRSFEINITSGNGLYDKILVSIEVRLPEYKILMESYHGLNDLFSGLSFYQMDFYNWMRDITDLNISIDYLAEFWTPSYDRSTSNSILTEELLAQYDLVVLQNPILPFNPLEFKNMKDYFDNGGNILFLGTRYQDLCVDNINDLFSYLNLGIEINNENIADENWLGIGATVDTQSITDLNHSLIFQDVNKFIWNYGSTLTVTESADVIAASNGKAVAAAYDNSVIGGGRFVAFGDLHWTADLYESSSYRQDHQFLTRNLMNYFFDKDNISIDIYLPSESTPSSQFNISIFIKDKNAEVPIDSTYLNSYLNVSVENDGYFDTFDMVSTSAGISINNTFSLPTSSDKPYIIRANLTIGDKTYNKTSKILYYNSSQIPQISSIFTTTDLERSGFESLDIDARLDRSSYDVMSYLSILPFSYYNEEGTINKTFILSNPPPDPFEYSISYGLNSMDPSGFVIFYILPYNPSFNYYNPHSPRLVSEIVNNPPEFDEETSNVIVTDTSQIIFFDETHTEDSVDVFAVSQGNQLEFEINIIDSVSYEDQDSSEMRVSVNFFIVSISLNNTIVPINPSTYIYSDLAYKLSSNTHNGRFTIPYTMSFPSITGTKQLSTASQYNSVSQDGYLAILMITAFDSEGESEDFIIALLIQPSLSLDLILPLIIIGVVVVIGIIVGISLYLKRKKKTRISTSSGGYYEQYYGDDSIQEPYEYNQEFVHYCPYCGYQLTVQRNFCPSCGKSLKLKE
ncbi:MAG: S8 family serine peptidase [Candidatus Lokiarchaeota archaeon]|nr:S8 family serine peptidase [Candidatus Lokiarchaeota archaeon]